MTQKQFNSEKKEKEEQKKGRKKKRWKLIKVAIGTLNTKFHHMLCMYIYYINYFIFIIYYHDGWFIGL